MKFQEVQFFIVRLLFCPKCETFWGCWFFHPDCKNIAIEDNKVRERTCDNCLEHLNKLDCWHKARKKLPLSKLCSACEYPPTNHY